MCEAVTLLASRVCSGGSWPLSQIVIRSQACHVLLCTRPDGFAPWVRCRLRRSLARQRNIRKQHAACGWRPRLARRWEGFAHVVGVERSQLVLRPTGELVMAHHEVAHTAPVRPKSILCDT